MHRWLADEDSLIPPRLGEPPACVDSVPCCRGMFALRTVLEVIRGNGSKVFRLVGLGYFLSLSTYQLKVAIGDGEIPAGVPVGGRSYEIALLGEAQAPGVVAGVLNDLKIGAVGKEAKDGLRGLMPRSTHSDIETAVAHCSIDPAIESMSEIRDASMGIS